MNRYLIIFFTATMMSSCFTSFAAVPSAIPPKLQSFVEKLESQKAELQGGAIAILYKGQVVYKTTFGNQKGDTGSITSTTLFPLASVSKPVSATAIALMVDQGNLSFKETFKLPYLKHPVNLRNILGHTTGYKFPGNSQIEKGMNRQKLLEVLKSEKPQCKPDECYTYSNIIFSLVEEALNTKKLSLHAAIKNLRTTLKTEGIQIVPIDSKMAVASPHSNGKSLPFPPYYPKAVPAAAGVFASLDGMIEVFKLSFGYKPDLISQDTLDSLHTPIISNRDIHKWNKEWPCERDKIESYYGLGWRILKAQEHPRKDLIFHSGYIAGISTFIGFIPSEEIGIIILLNQRSGLALNNGTNFWGVFLK